MQRLILGDGFARAQSPLMNQANGYGDDALQRAPSADATRVDESLPGFLPFEARHEFLESSALHACFRYLDLLLCFA